MSRKHRVGLTLAIGSWPIGIILAGLINALLGFVGAAQAQLTPIQAPPSIIDVPPPVEQVPPSVEARGNMFLRPPTESPSTRFVRFFREGEWYFSWGYSKQYWASTNIHVSQPSQGNDFTVHGVQGHDEPDLSGLLSGDLFGPQYNLRIGRFINEKRTIGIELSLDHSKYTVTPGQLANVTGTIGGTPVNANYVLDNNFFRYLLHNGANHLMTNLVYRLPLIGETNETLSVAFIGKAGVGIMVPHVDNTILGNPNDVGMKVPSNFFGIDHGWWQFGGWTTGMEAGFRVVLWKPVYLELTDKVAYSRLWNLPVYGGTADHSLLMNEIVLSLGFTYDGTTKH
jgi:hypothetical protein